MGFALPKDAESRSGRDIDYFIDIVVFEDDIRGVEYRGVRTNGTYRFIGKVGKLSNTIRRRKKPPTISTAFYAQRRLWRPGPMDDH